MSETTAPMSQDARALLRHDGLVRMQARVDLMTLQIRQQTAALSAQDTSFGHRSFVPDELSLSLAESTGTCRRRIDEAAMTVDHPRLMALVEASALATMEAGEVVVAHTFGIRHMDAVMQELAGAPDEVQEQVLDVVLADPSARTPHQLRLATRAALLLRDLEKSKDKQDQLHDRRGVTLFDEYDGSATLMVGGTKTRAAEMLAAIDAHVARPEPGDTRSLAQRRYDFVYDLLLGRVEATASWQALIVVSLSTLEGGDEPAEIPGLGLVSADEAREVLAQADLRRAVVDESGALVSLDDALLRGDLTPSAPEPLPAPSLELEPAPVADAPPEATLEDQAWIAAQASNDAAEAEHLAARQALRERRLMALCDSGMRQIEHHLREAALARAGWTVWRWDGQGPPPISGPPSGPSGPPSGPDDRPRPFRPGGDGQGTPLDGPPTRDDEEPSWVDRDWLQAHEDAAGTHDLLDRMAHAMSSSVLPATRRMIGAPSARAQELRDERLARQSQLSRWSSDRLAEVSDLLRSAPLTPVPQASRGYLFRGRLARWIRARDVTCTFPGCTRLAQRCELDHVVRWPFGPTEACNGACECVHHHQAKHASLMVRRLPDGTMLWTTRFGLTVPRPPRPLLRGW